MHTRIVFISSPRYVFNQLRISIFNYMSRQIRVQLPLSGLCLGFVRAFAGLQTGLAPSLRSVRSAAFPNPAHKRADDENPDFPPLARTPVNSPFEGLFVARERELEKGSSLTLLPYLLGYSSNCVSLSADLGVLTGARCSASLTRRCMRSLLRRFSRSSSLDSAFSAALRRFSASHMFLRDS